MSISSAFLFTFVEKQFVMKQVLYKNDIYPYNVRVLLGADEEYIAKTFANLEVEDQSWEGWTDDYGGRTIFVGNRTNHRKEICFLFHSLSDMDVRTIGHECLHGLSIYCKYLNMELSTPMHTRHINSAKLLRKAKPTDFSCTACGVS